MNNTDILTRVRNTLDQDSEKTDHRVDFQIHKEIVFVTIGSIVGAIIMQIPEIFVHGFGNISYALIWIVFGDTLSSFDKGAEFLVHVSSAVIVGIIVGVMLHRTLKIDVSVLIKGLFFGLIACGIVFAAFATPTIYLLLTGSYDAAMNTYEFSSTVLFESIFTHIIWGLVLGAITTALTRKYGANYRCSICDVVFSNTKTLKAHKSHVHGSGSASMKRILILGGGYAGVTVLNKIQKQFNNDVDVSINLISESNFFLHTPMLPEMATGIIEARHISTPIRKFCKRARFYQARVTSIELKNNQVIMHKIGENKTDVLAYDYLVIAAGMKTSFYGNKNIEHNAFTIKTMDDAINIRNHIIGILEHADQEHDTEIRDELMTFVVVGGGFAGVQMVGELNSFVRGSVKNYYHNIPKSSIKVILVHKNEKLLPEFEDLGTHAAATLTKVGVTLYGNKKLIDYANKVAKFSDGTTTNTRTLIWAGGGRVDEVILNTDTEHHESGRIITNLHLSLKNNPDIFVLGDCAFLTNPRNGIPYPPTAQHALEEANLVAENLTNRVKHIGVQYDFKYNTTRSMAKLGHMRGVAIIFGMKIRGPLAWIIWKHYNLSKLPTTEKKIRVGFDWFIDLFFPRDITRLSNKTD